MLEALLIKKEEISKLKITSTRPFDITCEKITQSPRIFNTTQIKGALENLNITAEGEPNMPEVVKRVVDYLIKEFFLRMHQTGLYNRQYKLWKTLGTASEATLFRLKRGLIKQKDLNISLVDICTDSKRTCACAIITKVHNINDIRYYLSSIIQIYKNRNLNGVFYFLEGKTRKDITSYLETLIYDFDITSRYESIVKNSKEIRLNAISISKKNNDFVFNHFFPDINRTKIIK